MKIAVSSYSFEQAMRDGRMNIFDVIPMAKKMGIEGVEIVRRDQTDREMRATAAMLKEQSEALGVPIIAYMVGADFIKNGVREEIDHLRGEAEIAAIMGAPRMRHDTSSGIDRYGNPVDFESAIAKIAEGCREVTGFAAGLGIKTMTENHGYFMQDSYRVERLINEVGHPNFGWLCDIGNFMCADEDCISAVKTASKYAVHAHAKDFHYKEKGAFVPEKGWFSTRGGNALRGAMIGHGDVDVKGCIGILKDAGYDGYLSVEFEGVEDCFKAIEENVRNLRKMI